MKKASLEKVFREIRRQTGYSFIYTNELLKDTRPVDVEVQGALDVVMDRCLKDQPLTYMIIEKVIVIKQKEQEKPELARAVTTGDPVENEIKGRVTNSGGEPLASASVVLKRTGYGTQTDANGTFKLKNTTPQDAIIISYTGYKQQTVAVGARTSFTLVMDPADNELDEAVVQAYGITTRRYTTSNIARVTAAEIERQPVMNPLLALQGKVAGLDVNQTSGFASAPIKVELRGRSNINSNFVSDPLYIIDGVPLTIVDAGNSNYTRGSTGFLQTGVNFIGPANGQSPTFNINPAHIESIEILKDADATAIYGSRGANGVILITTKKGKSGKTKFDLNIDQGITRVSRFWDMLNTQQYLQMRKEAFKNDNKTPTLGSAYDLLLWDTTRYTDWQKAIYGSTGKTTNVQASLTGGNTSTNFRIGAGYNYTTNILTVSGADRRASVSFSLTHRSLDQKLSISLTSAYSSTQSDMVSLPGKVTYAPNAPAIYDSVGNLNFAGWGGNTNNITARNAYPFTGLKRPYTSKTSFLNSSLQISYYLLKGLQLSTSLGFNSAQADQENIIYIASQDPISSPTGSNNQGYNKNRNWIIEPQVNYGVRVGKLGINVLAGGTIQHTNTQGVYITGTGYTSDDLIQTLSKAPSLLSSDFYGEYRYAALFGRLTLNWQNKYIVNLTARRDGSSRFGSGNQFGNFSSIGAAWIVTGEKWVQQHLTFLSFAKLRASFGTTGSDAVGDYQYITRWSSDNTQPYNGITSLVPTQHSNPNFEWQINKKLEGAIELGFLKDRINLSISYYRNRCDNQLVKFPTPSYTGFTSVTANSPALVQNSGLEFNMNTRIIDKKNVSWSINLNMAINRNKLVAYPDFELSPYYGALVIGQPLSVRPLLHYTGVNSQTGEYSFLDKNNDGQILPYLPTETDDRFFYNMSPKFFGGLGTNFSIKGIELVLFFNVKKQRGINAFNNGLYAGTLQNQPIEALRRWQKAGDVTSIARFTTTAKSSDTRFASLSDGAFTDASFIRLSNFSLAYNLPEKLIKKLGVQRCKFFINANNLLLITDYKGIDPETQNFGGLPPTRTIVGGISFNF